jgi:hypothetical protein
MGFRFFKRIKIFPGLTLNLSKTGASLSAGVRGAHVTVGSKGVRQTVGLPGTGLFYTNYKKHEGSTGDMNSGKLSNSQALPGKYSLLIIFILAILGLAAAPALGINRVWPVLVIAVVLYLTWKEGAADAKPVKPDPYQGIDKRFITASGEPKYSEAEIDVICESSNALVTLVSTSINVANESTDYDVRVLHTKNAKDAIATLQKYTEIYPGINMSNLDDIKHSIEMIEAETRSLAR